MVRKMSKISKENGNGTILSHILIPLDGSPLAECVIPHARAFAKAFHSDVTLLHVVERDDQSSAAQIDPVSWQLRKMEAQTYLTAMNQQWEPVDGPPEQVLLEGAAAERIIDYVDERDLDLLIVSSHGQGGLSKWNLSSVVQKVIYRAFRSFLLVRAFDPGCDEGAGKTYRRILVPLDGSKRAEIVLPFATKLAQTHEAELLLVYAVTRPAMVQQQFLSAEDSELVERLVNRNTAEATRYLEQVQARLIPQTEARLLVGHSTADTLLEFAETADIDLVILSAHGYSGENTRPYGSVVSSFIAYGSSPLLVIQDLPQDRIRPAPAEIVARRSVSSTIGLSKAIAYAQPAFWSY
jgi:nucleotide-binding universal stress UspA family protein